MLHENIMKHTKLLCFAAVSFLRLKWQKQKMSVASGYCLLTTQGIKYPTIGKCKISMMLAFLGQITGNSRKPVSFWRNLSFFNLWKNMTVIFQRWFARIMEMRLMRAAINHPTILIAIWKIGWTIGKDCRKSCGKARQNENLAEELFCSRVGRGSKPSKSDECRWILFLLIRFVQPFDAVGERSVCR